MPSEFICAISNSPEAMVDPVLDPTTNGRAYERRALEGWVRDHGTSFITGKPLRLQDITPDDELRQTIERWRDEQRDRFRYLSREEM